MKIHICVLVLSLFVLSTLTSFTLPSFATTVVGSSPNPIISYPPEYDWPMFMYNSTHSSSILMPAPGPSGGDPTPNILSKDKTGGAIRTSAAAAGGILYFVSANKMQAVNASTLNVVPGWPKNIGGKTASTTSSPAVAYGEVFVGSSNHTVFAFDAVTGSPHWRFNAGSSVFSSPTVLGGVVFIGSDSGTLFALDAINGSLLWSYISGGAISSSPAANGTVVAFGSDDSNVYFLNENNGTLIGSFTTGGPVESSPVFANGAVYFGSNDFNVYSLFVSSSPSVNWTFATQGPVIASPAVSDGRVYVGSTDGNLFAIDATTGVQVWSRTNLGSGLTSVALGNGVHKLMQPTTFVPMLYVATSNGLLYGIRRSDGATQWGLSLSGPIVSSPILAYTRVYVGTVPGTMFEIGSLKYSSAAYTFDPNTNNPTPNFPSAGGTIRFAANVEWGKFGINNTGSAVIVSAPNGTKILNSRVDSAEFGGPMTFQTGIVAFNVFYDFTYSHLSVGTYKVTIQIQDANPKYNSNNTRCCGYVDFKTTFTVT